MTKPDSPFSGNPILSCVAIWNSQSANRSHTSLPANCGPIHHHFHQCGHVFDSGQTQPCQNAVQANKICQGQDGRPPGAPAVHHHAEKCPTCASNRPASSQPDSECLDEESDSDSGTGGTTITVKQGPAPAGPPTFSQVSSQTANTERMQAQQHRHPGSEGRSRQSTHAGNDEDRSVSGMSRRYQDFPPQYMQHHQSGRSERSVTSSQSGSDSISEISASTQRTRVMPTNYPPGAQDQQPYQHLSDGNRRNNQDGPLPANQQRYHPPQLVPENQLPGSPSHSGVSNHNIVPQHYTQQMPSTAHQQKPFPSAAMPSSPSHTTADAADTLSFVQKGKKHDEPSMRANSSANPSHQSRGTRRKHTKSSGRSKRSSRHADAQRAKAAEHDANLLVARQEALRAEEAVFEQETQHVLAKSRPGSLEEELEDENLVRMAMLASLKEYTSSPQQRARQIGRQVLCIYTECGHQVQKSIVDDPSTAAASAPSTEHYDGLCNSCHMQKQSHESVSSRGERTSSDTASTERQRSSRNHSRQRSCNDASSIASSGGADARRAGRGTRQHISDPSDPHYVNVDDRAGLADEMAQHRNPVLAQNYQQSESQTIGHHHDLPAPSFVSLQRSINDSNAYPDPILYVPLVAGSQAASHGKLDGNRAREEANRYRLFQEAVQRDQAQSSASSSERPESRASQRTYRRPAVVTISSKAAGKRRARG